jgi:hypothetical protein
MCWLGLLCCCLAAAMGGAADALPITAKPKVRACQPAALCLHRSPLCRPTAAAPDPPLPPLPACLPAHCRVATRAAHLYSASLPG